MSDNRICGRCGKPLLTGRGLRGQPSPKTGEASWYHEECARVVSYTQAILQKFCAFDGRTASLILAEIGFELGILSKPLPEALADAELREQKLSEFDANYRQAFLFAARAHIDQRYGAAPYTEHLLDVARTLAEFGFSPSDSDPEKRGRHQRLCVAAILHDMIEDTNVGYEDIVSLFGREVADIVLAVTNEAGKNRREKYEKTYPKIKASPDALVIKLADRISNGRSCQKQKKLGLFRMYQKEWPAFEAALRDRSQEECEPMWESLERVFGVGKYSGMVTLPDEEGE